MSDVPPSLSKVAKDLLFAAVDDLRDRVAAAMTEDEPIVKDEVVEEGSEMPTIQDLTELASSLAADVSRLRPENDLLKAQVEAMAMANEKMVAEIGETHAILDILGIPRVDDDEGETSLSVAQRIEVLASQVRAEDLAPLSEVFVKTRPSFATQVPGEEAQFEYAFFTGRMPDEYLYSGWVGPWSTEQDARQAGEIALGISRTSERKNASRTDLAMSVLLSFAGLSHRMGDPPTVARARRAAQEIVAIFT